MMKRLMLLGSSLCIGLVLSVQADDLNDGGLESLRQQSLEVQDHAVRFKEYPKDNPRTGMAFVQQPPLVPHSVRSYQVDKNSNKCLSCHSFKNYKRYEAPKISPTHFADRDGNVLADVAPRRYFCMQCHVAQVEAEALIRNDFKPAVGLQ